MLLTIHGPTESPAAAARFADDKRLHGWTWRTMMLLFRANICVHILLGL